MEPVNAIIARDRHWKVPCANCDGDTPKEWLHTPASECKDCKAPDDHHEYEPLDLLSPDIRDQRAEADRRILLSVLEDLGMGADR